MPNQASMEKNQASNPEDGKSEEQRIFSQTDMTNQAPTNVGKMETEEKEDKEASFKVKIKVLSIFALHLNLYGFK